MRGPRDTLPTAGEGENGEQTKGTEGMAQGTREEQELMVSRKQVRK